MTDTLAELLVEHVGKTYETPRGPLTVLADVNLALRSGDAAAIMGPSGSGKSSLLYVLGALEAPSSGTVRLGGQNPFTLPPAQLAAFRNREIGFIFQDHCLLPQCSVLENVLVPTLVSRRPERTADPVDTARTLIAQIGLTDRIDHRPAALSGGEKQRVAIARALINQPRLLLCDEPTGNLDQASASSVASLLLQIHHRLNNVLVVVTHSARLADLFPIRFELTESRLRRLPADTPQAVSTSP